MHYQIPEVRGRLNHYNGGTCNSINQEVQYFTSKFRRNSDLRNEISWASESDLPCFNDTMARLNIPSIYVVYLSAGKSYWNRGGRQTQLFDHVYHNSKYSYCNLKLYNKIYLLF